MPRIKYREHRFGPERLRWIEAVNERIVYFSSRGIVLTKRQAYYRMVDARIIPNSARSYANLLDCITEAQYAGLIDWAAFEDAGREVRGGDYTFDDPKGLLAMARDNLRIDRWKDSKYRLEVWVEKDSERSLIAQPAEEFNVAHYSCHGYNSATEMWNASQRFRAMEEEDIQPVVLYLGDHDPSGLDMCRDIQDRLREFRVRNLEFRRLALNMDQIERYNPPPNPAKVTDSRYKGYVDEFGDGVWELSALPPDAMDTLIREAIQQYIDPDKWAASVEQEKNGREVFDKVGQEWDKVLDYLGVRPVEQVSRTAANPEDASDESIFYVSPSGDVTMGLDDESEEYDDDYDE